ncbi:hypothetical protein Tco_1315809 [Tanacetum coccineum]
MKNPKLCLRHEQIKICLLLKIHEQYSTADSGIDVTGLDATWTHNIATKETFEGNKNGTVSSPKNAATVHIEPVLYATKLNVPTNKTNFHVLECYFIGKRSVFPVVKLYIQNAWGKYGILKVIMNAKGFFFFKFLSLQGAKSVLQDGSVMIGCSS